ncbi:hypothetical protein N7456_012419 [Penicillium angulare]|uniref:DNA 3'-5' helicase n=1 Tax=Penicillium angulare TaxID=116970 RepID=A0A9W9EVI5_9EURO|nr:hypothetical protein N7456_012419 [Penicillium angulare]
MRRSQISPSTPFQPPTKRRRIESRFFTSSPNSATGIIDQRLIDGSQQSQSSNPLPQSFFSSLESITPAQDEDAPLDVFDLELLAQGTFHSRQAQPQLPAQESFNSRPAQQQTSHFDNIPPSIRGVVLVPVEELPEQYRQLFSFPLFNAVQSKCFNPTYNSNDNLILSAPTGSGKTVIMELAICRLLNILKDERFKVIYQAPTKSLCSERFRDWNSKFAPLKLRCAELTGDTDNSLLRNVQSSQIIITTPEKWDSMTRKWKDHMRLMQLVKLFLIDEVHILKESRGATLEAVVSRMKSIGSNVRFIALSATVPNSEDIATWLGKDPTNQHVPAHREHFGEDFRPVKLQKFVYGYQSSSNDFAFDKLCGSKLPEIINEHSCRKPIMIFCCTRNSSAATAKELARLWNMTNPPSRMWKGPNRQIEVNNEDLRTTISAGVAFHHAGLGPSDRRAVERGFLDGHINVICCTSTLAVGVNLPCHLVIIKNTVGWQDGGCKEYSDLEMMQMLGRAGRPQFDDSAVAVILTRKERVSHYERLVSGTESLESCLHLNLIDHLNAEIGLGNVTDVTTATKWLAGTFLFVRLRQNPTYYKLKEGASEEDEDDLLRQICEKDITLLQECGLVETGRLRSTPFGDAMARYYVRFETMKILLALEGSATISQILDVIVQAEEFREIRFKAGEKSLYKEINRDQGIRYPIKIDIGLPSHKISLLLQSELGAVECPAGDQFNKHRFPFQQDKSMVFTHVNRVIRCIIDCLIAREDSASILNALELARSFGAKVWDQSPLQMKQIEQVGVVAVRKLAAGGIKSIEELEDCEAHRIEMVLSKNPPFGTKLLSRLKDFPKLRISAKATNKDGKTGVVKINFKLEVAFMNDKTPTYFQRRPVYVCCLTETSDGRLIDFRRISASKLQSSLEITLVADLKAPDQYIVCHAMCDDIAGTARKAEIKPNISSYFASKASVLGKPQNSKCLTFHRSGSSRNESQNNSVLEPDTFEGDDLGLDDFLVADQRRVSPKKPQKGNDFEIFEEHDWLSISDSTPSPRRAEKSQKTKDEEWIIDAESQGQEKDKPVQLDNGNWACNHRCKDKTCCKHMCCRTGLEKPPKAAKKRAPATPKPTGLNQLTLSATITKIDSAKQAQKDLTKPKPVERSLSNLSNLSKRRKKVKRSKSDTSGRKDDIRSSGKSKKIQTTLKANTSDHDDDFSDFPFTSELLKDLTSTFRQPPSIKMPEIDIGNVTWVDLTKDDSTPCSTKMNRSGLGTVKSAQISTEATQLSLTPNETKITNAFLTSSPSKDIFTSPENTNRTSMTTPLNMASLNACSFKRKESTLDETTYLKPQKMIERYPTQEALSALDRKAMETETHSQSESEGSPGWEDVDRLLLEEFRDVINFY